MLERIEILEQDIRAQLEDDLVSRESKAEAAERLREQDIVTARLSQDNPFERFLQQYLRDQRDAYPDDREEPLCQCGHPTCELKEGRLPAAVRMAETVEAGIDEFQARHPQAVVLVEARDQWRERLADYRKELRDIRDDLVEESSTATEAPA